jgi:hypothetical protein
MATTITRAAKCCPAPPPGRVCCRETRCAVDSVRPPRAPAAIASLDGYVEDKQGRFDWAAPDDEVHAFVNEL